MLLTRAKQVPGGNNSASSTSSPGSRSCSAADDGDCSKTSLHTRLLSYLHKRDYTGALTLLEFQRTLSNVDNVENALWTAFCEFHLGNFSRSLEIYEGLCRDFPANITYPLYLAVVQFYLGKYKEAESNANKAKPSKLQNRLLFHIAEKLGDENKLHFYHQNLQDVVEDQVALAGMHYCRGHYNEAIDVYKRLLAEHPKFVALYVYMALCYYRLEFFDVAQEVLSLYTGGESLAAGNLKACLQHRNVGGHVAQQELEAMISEYRVADFGKDILEHNLNVFKCSASLATSSAMGGSSGSSSSNADGSGFSPGQLTTGSVGADLKSASAILPVSTLIVFEKMLDIVPEARFNLVLYRLRTDDIVGAYDMMKHVDPTTCTEYILKAVTNLMVGQAQESREHLKISQQFFQMVGSSPSECDTVEGRQCMASCFFLLRYFEDAAMYLNSIKTYHLTDDVFHMNDAQVKMALGQYSDAEESLISIQNVKIRNDFTYRSHLARCFIMNQKAKLAWEVYVTGTVDPSGQPGSLLAPWTARESYLMLQMLANDCYSTEQYYYAARAYDVLERLEPSPEHWEGKRGACIGVFQKIYHGQEQPEVLREIIAMMSSTQHPQVDYLVRIMKRWVK